MVRLQLDERQWQRIKAALGMETRPASWVRRFATRYEKTLRNYTAVVALGCALLWLRV